MQKKMLFTYIPPTYNQSVNRENIGEEHATLIFAFVDFKKAFDLVETAAFITSIKQQSRTGADLGSILRGVQHEKGTSTNGYLI